MIESTDPARPLFSDYFSVCGYFTYDRDKHLRYFFAGLKYPDGMSAFGIKADLGRINEKLAKEQKLLDLPNVDKDMMKIEGAETMDRQKEALELIRFVFATSYYIMNPGKRDYIKLTKQSGPRERDEKARKMKGNKEPLWTYSELTIERPEDPDGTRTEKGSLDTSHLTLEPTIVSPHIRRYGDKIVIVDAYDSQRWRKPDAIGRKTTL